MNHHIFCNNDLTLIIAKKKSLADGKSDYELKISCFEITFDTLWVTERYHVKQKSKSEKRPFYVCFCKQNCHQIGGLQNERGKQSFCTKKKCQKSKLLWGRKTLICTLLLVCLLHIFCNVFITESFL